MTRVIQYYYNTATKGHTVDGISPYTVERAADWLADFRLLNPAVDVHTVTVIMNDGTPILTITGTDDDMQTVSTERAL